MRAGHLDQVCSYVAGEWRSSGIQLCGLASSIWYEPMWLASGVPEVCSYVGLPRNQA